MARANRPSTARYSPLPATARSTPASPRETGLAVQDGGADKERPERDQLADDEHQHGKDDRLGRQHRHALRHGDQAALGGEQLSEPGRVRRLHQHRPLGAAGHELVGGAVGDQRPRPITISCSAVRAISFHQVAGDEDGPALPGQVLHQVADPDDPLRVQPVDRLVHDQHQQVVVRVTLGCLAGIRSDFAAGRSADAAGPGDVLGQPGHPNSSSTSPSWSARQRAVAKNR
jgi:hypothetical protein